MDMETIIMEIIAKSGAARDFALTAIETAVKKDKPAYQAALKRAEAAIGEVHNVQTSLIQQECSGNGIEVTLLMVHAQDHLMAAMTIIDIAKSLSQIMEGDQK